MMLNAVALEDFLAAVVGVNRHGDDDRPFWIEQAVAFISGDVEVIGHGMELLPGHIEHRTSVHHHR